MKTVLSSEIKKHIPPSSDCFAYMMNARGEIYRELEGRRTQRAQWGDKNYFIKQHFGIGWKEIFKNLFQCRWPVISAKNEWLALQRLQALSINVPKIAGYGCQGLNPSSRHSFLITQELPKNISLEDFCRHWSHCPPSFTVKINLIKEVARIARTMHADGINHRDFYMCHFLLDVSELLHSRIKLYLIDLHRAQFHARIPERWLIKDLAGLYFSSKEAGLSQRDILRFMKEYRNTLPLRSILSRELTFWLRVKERGNKLYKKHRK